ncbi:MAG TPA: TolC family protein [Bacteroidia bacterium]|nr:TolC family protein [Bacteroidia bacterium]
MNNKAFGLLCACMLSLTLSQAQEQLTLQQALDLALKNNYSITIARNQSDIARNDATYGNAGMLPQLFLAASGNLGVVNTHQVYASGLEVQKPGVQSTSLSAGPQINWVLFDGLRMFATYDKLKELRDMGEINAKIMIENTIAKIIDAYYDVVRQKELQKALDEAIAIYQERVNIAETKSRIGSGSEADVLQARVDLNEQKSALLRQKVLILNAKTNLNLQLSRDSYAEFDVNDSIVITYKPRFEELKTTAVKENKGLLFAEKNVKVANYALKEVTAQRYPYLAVNAGYAYSRSTNSAGFVLLNQNLGFNAGFTASWNIFNGGNVNRMVRDAQIVSLNNELQYKEIRNEVESGLITAFNNYQNAMETLKLEEDNIQLARSNVNINLERFRLGYVTSLQLKDAQKSFIDAEGRLVSARYDAKVAETELMRLNGALVK